jgi:hypothetical protein
MNTFAELLSFLSEHHAVRGGFSVQKKTSAPGARRTAHDDLALFQRHWERLACDKENRSSVPHRDEVRMTELRKGALPTPPTLPPVVSHIPPLLTITSSARRHVHHASREGAAQARVEDRACRAPWQRHPLLRPRCSRPSTAMPRCRMRACRAARQATSAASSAAALRAISEARPPQDSQPPTTVVRGPKSHDHGRGQLACASLM